MTSDSGQRIRTPVDLGIVIRERRRALELDQRSLASRVGVSRQWIVEIEKGKARAGIGLVLRTLQAVGLEPQVVLVGHDEVAAGAASIDDLVDIDAIVDRARAVTQVDRERASPRRKAVTRHPSVRAPGSKRSTSSRKRYGSRR